MESARQFDDTCNRKAESDAALEYLTREFGSTWPNSVATVHAYRGERDALLRWLEKAHEARDPDLAAYQGGDPALAPLRGDP